MGRIPLSITTSCWEDSVIMQCPRTFHNTNSRLFPKTWFGHQVLCAVLGSAVSAPPRQAPRGFRLLVGPAHSSKGSQLRGRSEMNEPGQREERPIRVVLQEREVRKGKGILQGRRAWTLPHPRLRPPAPPGPFPPAWGRRG